MRILTIVTLALMGCYQHLQPFVAEDGGDGDADADGDADGDGDGDGDSDSDGDADGDSDADFDAEGDGSWPEGPGDLEELGVFDLTNAVDVFVADGYAYVTNLEEFEGGLRVIDVSDPTRLRRVAYIQFEATNIHGDDGYVYVCTNHHGVRIFDVADPTSPRELVHYITPGDPHDLWVHNGRLLVADGYEGLRVLDVSTPSSPRELGFLIMTGEATGVVADASLAFTISMDNLIRSIDLSEPPTPRELGQGNIPETPSDLAVEGGIAYVAASDAGIRIIDVSAPESPMNVGSFGLQLSGWSYRFRRVAARGSFIYVGGGLMDWNGIFVVDVTDPAHPVEVARHRTEGSIEALFVTDEHLFVAEDRRGLVVYSR